MRYSCSDVAVDEASLGFRVEHDRFVCGPLPCVLMFCWVLSVCVECDLDGDTGRVALPLRNVGLLLLSPMWW